MEGTVSKRQRFYNMVKTTKDVYIPAVGTSLSNLKNGTSTSLKNYYDRNNNFAYSNKNLPHGSYEGSDKVVVPETQNSASTKIITYTTYTHYNLFSKKYMTTIKGAVVMDGVMNRKNRILYSVVKKLIQDPHVEHKVQAEDEIKHLVEHDDLNSLENSPTRASEFSLNVSESNNSTPQQKENFSSDEDSFSTSSFSPPTTPKRYMSKSEFLSGNAVFNERISAFFSKGLPNINMDITVNGQQLTDPIKTNPKGYFTYVLITENVPHNVVFSISDSQPFNALPNNNTKIESEVQIINCDQKGFAVISDIDDTIKQTGILLGKRAVATNTFVHEYEQWSIPSMSTWYHDLKQKTKCDFFYVSNSPIQLYAPLKEFIYKYYPPGAIFLKEYASGGYINNLMLSSSKRKLESIKNIVSNFPHKEFLLIGDSGEHDLEAYLEICQLFPSQILAVYIRCSKGSMTDNNLSEENSIVQKLNEYINKNLLNVENTQNERIVGSHNSLSPAKYTTSKAPPPPPPRSRTHILSSKPQMKNINSETFSSNAHFQDQPTGHNLATRTKIPPPVPPKRQELRSKPVEQILKDSTQSSLGPALSVYKKEEKPGLENTCVSPTNINAQVQGANSATNLLDEAYCTPSSQNDYGAYDQYFDKRLDGWRNRVKEACFILKDIHQSEGFKIQLKFFQKDCLEESQKLFENHK
ncbi:hypothetical protein ACO0QE_001041 [Hanseniaspora vineae]